MAKEDGGSFHHFMSGNQPQPGCTMRDWFAGMALQGLIAKGDWPSDTTIEDVCRKADTFAAAMLIVRKG